MFYLRLMKSYSCVKKCSKVSFFFLELLSEGKGQLCSAEWECWQQQWSAMHCLRKDPCYQLCLQGAVCLSHCHTSKALVILDHGICLQKEFPVLPAPVRILGLYMCGVQHHEDNKVICGLCYCVPSVHGTLLFQKIVSHPLTALTQAVLMCVCSGRGNTFCTTWNQDIIDSVPWDQHVVAGLFSKH